MLISYAWALYSICEMRNFDCTYIERSEFDEGYSLQIFTISNQNSMRAIQIPLFIFFFSLLENTYELVHNRSFKPPDNAIDLIQSPDGKILAAYNQSQVLLYHSYTGKTFSTIKTESEIISVAFSQNSNKFSIVFLNGSSDIYLVYEQSGKYEIEKIKQKTLRQINEEIYPIGSCFTFGDYLIIAFNDGVIFGQGTNFVEFLFVGVFNQTDSPRLACSPSNTPQFAIAGGFQQENSTEIVKISTFILNSQLLQIEQVKTMYDQSKEYVNYISYDNLGKYLYVLGNESIAERYDLQTETASTFYEGESEMYKIQAPSDKTYAVVNATHIIYIQRIENFGKQKIVGEIQEYASDLRTFTFLSTRLFYIGENHEIIALDFCLEGQFYDGTQCQLCSETCKLCSSSKDTCHECVDKYYYLQDPQCLRCVASCQICVDGLSCLACIQGYDLNDKLQCIKEGGVKFWVLGVVVGSAVVLLASIAIVSIIIMRKKQAEKRKAFLQSDEDQIDAKM